MEKRTVSYSAVLKDNFYCYCGAWVYCPEMNGTKTDDQNNEVPCIGEGCVKHDEEGEFMECPECGIHYYIVK